MLTLAPPGWKLLKPIAANERQGVLRDAVAISHRLRRGPTAGLGRGCDMHRLGVRVETDGARQPVRVTRAVQFHVVPLDEQLRHRGLEDGTIRLAATPCSMPDALDRPESAGGIVGGRVVRTRDTREADDDRRHSSDTADHVVDSCPGDVACDEFGQTATVSPAGEQTLSTTQGRTIPPMPT